MHLKGSYLTCLADSSTSIALEGQTRPQSPHKSHLLGSKWILPLYSVGGSRISLKG